MTWTKKDECTIVLLFARYQVFIERKRDFARSAATLRTMHDRRLIVNISADPTGTRRVGVHASIAPFAAELLPTASDSLQLPLQPNSQIL